ncbi:MAG: WD40 repeat domain lipoprotein [Idiomarinaceae bacterium HL-53]|nr:MAG: WD40 repeat domain lipoprotein [Idiomarinaceae bacterium HL-53]CUS48188.1 WD domain-containing protein, G-beta repeat-containing protein [Idiomarinaceae bacterium HL-53]
MFLDLKTLHVALICLVFAVACTPRGQLEKREQRTQSSVQAAAISSNGALSLVASAEEGLRLFDNESETLRHNWQQEDEGISQLISVAFTYDGTIAVAASRMTLALWDSQSGDILGAWRNDESAIFDIAVANQGSHIVFARNDNKVILFEPSTGRRLEFLGHTDRVNQVAISPNGRYVLSGGNDHRAFLWDTESGQVVHEFPMPGRVLRVTLDMSGTFALVSSATQSNIFHLVSGEIISELQTNVRQKVFSAASFRDDLKLLVTGTASRQVEIWNVESGERIANWHVEGQEGEHPPQAAILATRFIEDDRVRIETSAGYGEIWRFELPEVL